MGNELLTLIPRDPWFLPDEGNIEKAMLLLSTLLPKNHGVKYAIEEIPIFLHPVEGYEGIYCPFCGQDLEDWSWDVMNAMYDENKFEALVDITLPCCRNHTSLNNLDFREDGGFAVFRIEMWNPSLPLQDVAIFPDTVEVWGGLPEVEHVTSKMQVQVWLSSKGLGMMESALGTPLKQFHIYL